MKKILAVSLALNVAAVLGFAWKELAAHAAGGGGVPVGNGDVNGDGKRDISDAVYTLSWLFTGGPAPVPIGTGLPATGETRCYSTSGFEITCGSAAFPGQDGFYKAGCPVEGRFVDHGDGTVTDTCTGLMWQKSTADVSGNGTTDGEDSINWQEALTYCEGLDFAGHRDWRLPNVRELQSIVDYGRSFPAIDPVFRAVSDLYWSSTTYADISFHAVLPWRVDFSTGSVDSNEQISYIRAVRGGL